MKFSTPLLKARLVKRYKRFLADAILENGDEITAHCANPGAMLGLKDPDMTIWLSESNNPKRKLKYSWELVQVEDYDKPSLVGINTAHPNKLVEEAILGGKIKELDGYGALKREVKYGKNSRIDILLSDENKADCYVEVKNVHLMREQGLAEFPDSVTTRGAKHLRELSDMVAEGHRSVLVFLIQRDDADNMTIAKDIDPAYAEAMDEALKAGVEILAYSCDLSINGIEVTKSIPFAN